MAMLKSEYKKYTQEEKIKILTWIAKTGKSMEAAAKKFSVTRATIIRFNRDFPEILNTEKIIAQKNDAITKAQTTLIDYKANVIETKNEMLNAVRKRFMELIPDINDPKILLQFSELLMKDDNQNISDSSTTITQTNQIVKNQFDMYEKTWQRMSQLKSEFLDAEIVN